MSFKYLRCCEDLAEQENRKDQENQKDYLKYFKFCHMPLDSFTLMWFKRNFSVKPECYIPSDELKTEWVEQNFPVKAGRISTWSAMENNKGDDYTAKNGKTYYTYRFYVKSIRKYIEKHFGEHKEFAPLELEFVEWPKIQLALSAEGFLFGLKGDLDSSEKKSIIALSLEEKYKQICEVLDERGYRSPR